MKPGEFALLFGKMKFLVKPEERTFSTQFGEINLRELYDKNFGDTIKSHMGDEFVIIRPTILDFMRFGASRGPAAITHKDFGLILSMTMPPENAKIVEAGTGSGFNAMFLASVCKSWTVYTYELRKDFAKISAKNFAEFGFGNIVAKNKDILKGIDEKDADLVVLDMDEAEKAVPLARDALKIGGYLAIFSPYIEQAKAGVKAMEISKFIDITTVESIMREWDVREHTLPKRSGTMHTAFITVGRKNRE